MGGRPLARLGPGSTIQLHGATGSEERTRAIGECLRFLEAEAQESKLDFLAHLIGVAAMAAKVDRDDTEPPAKDA